MNTKGRGLSRDRSTASALARPLTGSTDAAAASAEPKRRRAPFKRAPLIRAWRCFAVVQCVKQDWRGLRSRRSCRYRRNRRSHHQH